MDTQKFIRSVEIDTLHQMKPYSRVKTNWQPSDKSVSVFRELEQVREIGPKCPKSWASRHGKSFKVLNSRFYIKWRFTQIQIPFKGWFTPLLVCLGHWGKSGKLRPNTQNHGHIIQSVKLFISHQMKPYLNIKAIWKSVYTCFCVSVELGQVGHSSYTCFSIFGELGQVEEIGPT